MSDSIQYKSIGFHNINNRKSFYQMMKDIVKEDPQNPIIEKINKNNQAIDKNDKPIKGEFGWFNSSFAPVRSFGKGVVHGTGELIEGGVGGTVAGFVTAPYGYYTGDYTLDLEDPNHKEYKDAYDYIDEYKKTVNPFISGDDGNKLLLDYRSDEYPEGFKNSFFGGTGLQTRRSPETQLKAIQGNSIIQASELVNDFIIETSNVKTWGAVDDTYMNSFFQSVPNLLTQVALSRINPGYGMTYASTMMYSGSYMEAKPFVEAGELSVNDAVSLAQLTATTSWLWNAGPSHFWATKPNSVGMQKIFFNQLKKRKLYKPYTTAFAKGSFIEMIQEVGDEQNLMWGASQYRDVSFEEWAKRTKQSAFGGFMGGGFMSGGLNYFDRQQTHKFITEVNEVENSVLPKNMNYSVDGKVTFDINRKDFDSDESYESTKKLVEDPEFIKKVDPEVLSKKNPEVPINLMIMHEFNAENPNTDDIEVTYNALSPEGVMTEEEVKAKGYDPNHPDFLKAEIREGDVNYDENTRKFKVKKDGRNGYSDTGGNIVLSSGANQDVYVEELVEVLYKKLETTNPELKQKIDKWIVDMGGVLDQNDVRGVRDIELFSKWFTFNYLGYQDTHNEVGEVVALPDDIVNEFGSLLGEQKDGTNVSHIFKGGEPLSTEISQIVTSPDFKTEVIQQDNIITEEDAKVEEPPVQDNIITEEDAKVDEPPVQDNLLDEESFRIVPVDAGESKGTFFIAGDPANLNLEGEQEDFGIRYPDTHKGWAVSQVPATKIKKQVDAGNNVIVITSMGDAKSSLKINETYHNALKRDGIEKVGEEQFNKLLEKHDGDIFKASKEAGVNQTEVAKQVAVPDFEQIKGKIVAVATVKDIRTGEDRNNKHPVYPYEINFDTYYRLPEPIDFDTYLKDLPDYTNKKGKVISRSQWGKLMANTYNLSVLRGESELNQKLINFANTGDYDALGVETKGFQMASPQVEEIGLDEAVSNIKSKETIDYHRINADLEVAMGLTSTTKSAVGEWETGAEPSIVTEITGDVTMEQLDLLGAMKGILGTDGKVGQLQILNFVAKEDGPHTTVKVEVDGDIKDIKQAVKELNDIGLTFKTLPITGNKFNLLFVDMDGSVLNLVKEIYNEQKITTTKGEANFIGSDKSRPQSEKIFLDIINKNAKKYPELGKQFRKSITNHRPRFDNSKLTYRLTPVSQQSSYIDEININIDDVKNLSKRHKKILIDNGIETTKDYLLADKDDLLNYKGLGEKSLNLITKKIESAINEEDKIISKNLRDEKTLNETLNNIESNKISIVDKTKDKIETIKKIKAISTIEKYITPISTLLENIHPKLKRVLRKFEFNIMSKSHKRRTIVKDFYDKAKKMSKVDYNKLDILFKNSSMETSQNEINKLLNKYNLQSEYKAIRDMLDEIRQEAIDSGIDIGFIENYIPRIVKDLEKLRTDVFGLDPELQTTYNKLVEEARKKLKRDLEQEEKAHIVDLILRGHRSLESGKPDATKQRKVSVVTNEMNKNYVHSSEALIRHIEAMTTEIETRNLLGKNENTTDNISNYIVEIIEDVGLSDEQISQVKEILIARLNPSPTSPLTGLIRNTTYILTMGSYTSALTQIGDLTWALYEAGIFETTRSVLTHFSKNNTKMEQIYFNRIGQEFEEGNYGADAVNTVFKYSGLNRMDRLGKEALINSLLRRYQRDAKKLLKGKKSEKLNSDIEAYFDTNDITTVENLIQDLADGNLTEDVKLLIFNKVLDYQPMAKSEMPLKYIEGDTSRLFYQLKTFSLRQLDVFRKKLITDVKNAKGPKAKAKALYEFSKILTMFLMAGVSKDVLKDLAMGRDLDDLEDYIKENLFQLVLFSRYQYYKVKEEGPLGVTERFIAPPSVSSTFRFSKAFYDYITPRELTESESKLSPYEIKKIREKEKEKDLSNLVKWIPVLGKHFHWRSDTGREKDLNIQMKELERKIKELRVDGKRLNKKDKKEYLRVIRDARKIKMITPDQWENKMDSVYGN